MASWRFPVSTAFTGVLALGAGGAGLWLHLAGQHDAGTAFAGAAGMLAFAVVFFGSDGTCECDCPEPEDCYEPDDMDVPRGLVDLVAANPGFGLRMTIIEGEWTPIVVDAKGRGPALPPESPVR